MRATRAAGVMLLPHETRFAYLLAAAAVVHPLVSLGWATVHLRFIAPAFFPAVAALDFWPQFADHLMWGATFGEVLRRRAPAAA